MKEFHALKGAGGFVGGQDFSKKLVGDRKIWRGILLHPPPPVLKTLCSYVKRKPHSSPSEMWEVDVTQISEWKRSPFHKTHKCRRLPWEMPWLGASGIIEALSSMTRVDRDARPSWSEGITIAETYRSAALLVTLKPGFEDGEDGKFTICYPVAHPDPRGVSEREDFDWSRAKYVYCSADFVPDDDYWERVDARKDWVHKNL